MCQSKFLQTEKFLNFDKICDNGPHTCSILCRYLFLSIFVGCLCWWTAFTIIFKEVYYTNDGEDGARDGPHHSDEEYDHTLHHGNRPRERQTEAGDGQKWRLLLPEGEQLEERREDEGQSCTGKSSNERNETVQIWNTHSKCSCQIERKII